jgi:hypothetical protein
MDTLRPPRERDQKPWEWRRDAPVRPVVFRDPETMDETTVHLHLEQRVVQRLLGRFLAQGFVHHDLSRACLAQTTDAIPRVILLGRLCLFGPHAARLHEELLTVTARWIESDRRRPALQPYARDAEARTLTLLEESLLPAGRGRVTDVVERRLRGGVARDVRELLPHLNARGTELAAEAERLLADRGEREAKSMRDILQAQQKRIRETARKYDDDPQFRLRFAGEHEEESRQAEADRRYWDKRLAAIALELDREPARIREVYAVRARRIEPVGLVYLWPVTG